MSLKYHQKNIKVKKIEIIFKIIKELEKIGILKYDDVYIIK